MQRNTRDTIPLNSAIFIERPSSKAYVTHCILHRNNLCYIVMFNTNQLSFRRRFPKVHTIIEICGTICTNMFSSCHKTMFFILLQYTLQFLDSNCGPYLVKHFLKICLDPFMNRIKSWFTRVCKYNSGQGIIYIIIYIAVNLLYTGFCTKSAFGKQFVK